MSGSCDGWSTMKERVISKSWRIGTVGLGCLMNVRYCTDACQRPAVVLELVTGEMMLASTPFKHAKPLPHWIVPAEAVTEKLVTEDVLDGPLKKAQVPPQTVAPASAVDAGVLSVKLLAPTEATTVPAGNAPVP